MEKDILNNGRFFINLLFISDTPMDVYETNEDNIKKNKDGETVFIFISVFS